MPDRRNPDPRKTLRTVSPRRIAVMGTLTATAVGSTALGSTALGDDLLSPKETQTDKIVLAAEGEGEAAASGEGEGQAAASAEGGAGEAAASGEGEGEGEGEGGDSGLAPEIALLRDLGFMTGHLRAGLALYEEGDLEDARTHIGHPIEEKYEAVAEPLEKRGFGDLRDQITALSEAAQKGADYAEIEKMFNDVIATVEEVRADSDASTAEQMMALAALGRIAAEEYEVAIKDGEIDNLHEYQDSWGFLRTIETEARQFAQSDDQAAAEAAQAIIEQVEATSEAFGTLNGEDIPKPDPSILYGAAARMELAAMGMT